MYIDCISEWFSAARSGALEAMRDLMKRGCVRNVNYHNQTGAAALHLAAANGWKNVVDFLLDKGADVNKQDNDGNTPLHRAAERGYIDIVQSLLDKNADIFLKNNEGNNACAVSGYATSREKGVVESFKGLFSKKNKKERVDFKAVEALLIQRGEAAAINGGKEKSPSPKSAALQITPDFVPEIEKREELLSLSSKQICERLMDDNWLPLFQKTFQDDFAPIVEKMNYNDAMRAYVNIYKKLSKAEEKSFKQAVISLSTQTSGKRGDAPSAQGTGAAFNAKATINGGKSL